MAVIFFNSLTDNASTPKATNNTNANLNLVEKQQFEKNIESVFDRLKKAGEAGDDEAAMALLQLFEKYNRMDYEGVSDIKKKVRLNVNTKIINASSYTNVRTVYTAYVELAELEPTNKVYADKRDELKPKVDELDRIEKAQKTKADLAKKREKKIKAQFSGWDGSHYGLKHA